jgi:Questin oxidase-like
LPPGTVVLHRRGMGPSRREILGAGVSVLVAPLLGCHDPSRAGATAAAAPSPTPPAAPPPSVAQRILEANRHYDAQFHHGLSNHLSMAIIALDELGAPDARLSEFFERYRSRLEPVPERREPIVRARWAEALGTESRYADYLAFFQAEVARAGADGAVRAYLPALMPGVAGSSFHPLIRLGYAAHARDDADVAVSLAYFADQFLRLGGAPASAGSSSAGGPLDLLRSIAETPALAHHPQGNGAIFEQIRAVATMPEFATAAASALAARDVTVPSLADAAAALYAAAPNFATLHVVTSAHALRVLSPLLDDPAAASRWLLQAFGAVYVAMGTPAVNRDEDGARAAKSTPPSWEAIAAAAAASNDEHVIKMVYTCREEASAYRQPLYQSFAAKKAGI